MLRSIFICGFAVGLFLSCSQCQSNDTLVDANYNGKTILTTADLQSKFAGKQANFDESFKVSQTDVIIDKAQLFADHYPSSNERRIDLFRPYIENLGGAYIGVGTDQNLTFIAWARSPVAYLMDFDSVIVYVNKLHLLFLKESADFATFKSMWSQANRNQTLDWLKENLGNRADYQQYLQAYNTAMVPGMGVAARLNQLDWMSAHYGFKSFHNDVSDYNYLRQMVLDGRIQAIVGDMNATVSFQQVSASAKRLNIPIRLVYFSNAEEYFRYPDGFRHNIENLYTDDLGFIVRTVTSGAKEFGFPDGELLPDTFPFHYNLQSISKMKIWMKDTPHPLWVYQMLKARTDVKKGFSVLMKDPYEAGFLKPSANK